MARAGRSVLVLERAEQVGGAAVSAEAFPGAQMSRYAYLVSLFPRSLLAELGLAVELRRRDVAWYAPGSPVDGGGDPGLARLRVILGRLARRVFPTLTEPLRSRDEFRRLVGDEEAWERLFERPLSELLESALDDDAVRGVALTDATIGTFAAAVQSGYRLAK